MYLFFLAPWAVAVPIGPLASTTSRTRDHVQAVLAPLFTSLKFRLFHLDAFVVTITIIWSNVSPISCHHPVGEPPLRPVSPDPVVLHNVVAPQPQPAPAPRLLQLHYEAVLLRGGDGHQLRGVEAGAQQPGLGPRHLPGNISGFNPFIMRLPTGLLKNL